MFNSIYKIKYEKLKKDFDNKVNKKANELFRERQDNWKIKEEQYKQEIRLKKLELREKDNEIRNLNAYIDRIEYDRDRE